MCRTINGCTKKCRLKSSNQKKFKDFTDRLTLSNNNGLLELQGGSQNSDCDVPPFIIHRKEKSRLAAKKRRSVEGECLTELYLSLPVAPQSRLLSCEDAQFIGNFEKTTIIKVSAYVLKLYNSLSECQFLRSYSGDHYPVVSLFSQSMFGLFWCESSSKVVFTTPGLACLTGLYWCNIIGMPLNSIILDKMDWQSLDIPSNMVFLRFMANGLKDRGIFTVHTNKVKENDNYMHDQKIAVSNSGLRRDFIGTMPCSIWSTTYLGGGIHFDLIQPLATKVVSIVETKDIIDKLEPSSDNFKTNGDYFNNSCVVFSPLFAVFHIDTLETLSVDADLIKSLGIRNEHTKNSTLYSFFSLHCVVAICKYIQKLIAGESQIERCVAQLCTSRSSIFRMAVVTLQICEDKNVILPSTFNSRSFTNQGEAYSQNVVNVLSSLDGKLQNDQVMDKAGKKSWIQAKFQLLPKMFYNNKKDIPPASFHRRVLRRCNPVINENWICNKCVLQDPRNIFPAIASNNIMNQSSQDNYYFQSNNQQISLPPTIYQNYFGSTFNHGQQNVSKPLTPQTSILMRELMKPR